MLEGPAIGAGSQRMVLLPHESDHTECGGVYISTNPIRQSAKKFIPSTPNNEAKNQN